MFILLGILVNLGLCQTSKGHSAHNYIEVLYFDLTDKSRFRRIFFLLTQFIGDNKVGKISWNLVWNIMNWETHWSSKHHFRLGNTLINLETELLTTKHYFEVKIFRELETWKYVSKLIMVFPTKYVFPSS